MASGVGTILEDPVEGALIEWRGEGGASLAVEGLVDEKFTSLLDLAPFLCVGLISFADSWSFTGWRYLEREQHGFSKALD